MTDQTSQNRARYTKDFVSGSLDKYWLKCLAKHLWIYYNSLSAITRLGLGWVVVVRAQRALRVKPAAPFVRLGSGNGLLGGQC